MSDLFPNKVAASGLITLDLEAYLPDAEIVMFDMKDYLFMGLILKEKDFREALKNQDWSAFEGKICGHHLYGRCHHSRMGLHACCFLPAACGKGCFPRYGGRNEKNTFSSNG